MAGKSSINLRNLTAAPWIVREWWNKAEVTESSGANPIGHPFFPKGTKVTDGRKLCQLTDGFRLVPFNDTDAEFIAIARNAFAGDPESLAWWEANRQKAVRHGK